MKLSSTLKLIAILSGGVLQLTHTHKKEVSVEDVFDTTQKFVCRDVSNGRGPNLMMAEEQCEGYVHGQSEFIHNCEYSECRYRDWHVGKRRVSCRLRTLGMAFGMSNHLCEMLECDKSGSEKIAACRFCQCGDCITTPNNQGVAPDSCSVCYDGTVNYWPCDKGFCGCAGQQIRMDRGRPLLRFRKKFLATASSDESGLLDFVRKFVGNLNSEDKEFGCDAEAFDYFNDDGHVSAFANIRDFVEGLEDGNKRSVLALLAHAAHESGLFCFVKELGATDDAPDYCSHTDCAELDMNCECNPDVNYFGRGPLQLSYNYNYAQFSADFYMDEKVLLDNPNLVVLQPGVGWQSAIWFWFTPQYRKPSAHIVMNGTWVLENDIDIEAGRNAGFGLTIDIVNGGGECGGDSEESRAQHRRELYEGLLSDNGMTDDRQKDCVGMLPYGEEGPWAVDDFKYTDMYEIFQG